MIQSTKKMLIVNNKKANYSFEHLREDMEDMIYYEARDFVKNNHYLDIEVEDVEQELTILLYRCFNQYDIKHDLHFSTYFITAVKNYFSRVYRDNFRLCRKDRLNETSLFKEVDTAEEDTVTLGETIASTVNVEHDVVTNDLVAKVNKLSSKPHQQEVLLYWLGEITVNEIAKKHNITKQGVYKRINTHREMLLNQLGDEIYAYFTE